MTKYIIGFLLIVTKVQNNFADLKQVSYVVKMYSLIIINKNKNWRYVYEHTDIFYS